MKVLVSFRTSLLLLSAGLFAAVVSGEDNDATAGWHQWRGAQRDGSVAGPVWPTDFERLETVWHVELGKGYGGPIVTEDRVFVTETAYGRRASVRALRRDDGRELWSTSWEAKGGVPFYARSQGAWERSTPAYADGVLYVGDMKEVLRAFDGETGKELWRVDFPRRFELDTPPFGFASSPLVDGEHLFVQAANGIVKLDRRTGEILWRAAVTPDSVMSAGAFSSPILTDIEGIRQLVVFTRSYLSGVDPDSGRTLWSTNVPSFRGMNIVTPLVQDDGVFVSQHRNGSHFFRVRRAILSDEDGDDLTRFVVDPVWTNKGSGYMSSPVVIGDHVYQHLGNGRLSSIDLRTGDENWRTRPLGEYWSMVRQRDRILALDSEGTLRLVRASPEAFELLAQREVADESTWGHLAVSGDMIVVRGLESVIALRWSTRH